MDIQRAQQLLKLVCMYDKYLINDRPFQGVSQVQIVLQDRTKDHSTMEHSFAYEA
jgi:hypothetical protein